MTREWMFEATKVLCIRCSFSAARALLVGDNAVCSIGNPVLQFIRTPPAYRDNVCHSSESTRCFDGICH